MDLSQLQHEQAEWAARNFGTSQPGWKPLLGIMEELGELSHAHLKMSQGIRGSHEQHRAEQIDAVGDIAIFLADYCTREQIDLDRAVSLTWETVRRRDWRQNPLSGTYVESGPL